MSPAQRGVPALPLPPWCVTGVPARTWPTPATIPSSPRTRRRPSFLLTGNLGHAGSVAASARGGLEGAGGSADPSPRGTEGCPEVAASPGTCPRHLSPRPGRHGAVFHRHLLLRGGDQDHRPGLRLPQRLLPAQRLERHGLRGGAHGVRGTRGTRGTDVCHRAGVRVQDPPPSPPVPHPRVPRVPARVRGRRARPCPRVPGGLPALSQRVPAVSLSARHRHPLQLRPLPSSRIPPAVASPTQTPPDHRDPPCPALPQRGN